MQASFETVKCSLLLSADKLIYNEQVLQEKKLEHEATLQDQRKRLVSQRELLARIKVSSAGWCIALTGSKFVIQSPDLKTPIILFQS